VANGYARNFLLPRRLAVPADSASAQQIEHALRIIKRKDEKRRNELNGVASDLGKVTLLIKVRAVGKEREEMKRTTDIFRGRIIDVTEKTYTIELTGNKSKLDAFIDAIDRTAILETVRTGGSGIGRGERILKV